MDISSLMSDETLEEEGVWTTLSSALNEETGELMETAVKIARINNPAYVRHIKVLRKPYRNLILAGQEIPEDKQLEITCQLFAKTIVKDWKGFTQNGEPFPYSFKNALQLLRESRKFRDICAALAQEDELFAKQAEAQVEGNSEDSPSGGPTTAKKKSGSGSSTKKKEDSSKD